VLIHRGTQPPSITANFASNVPGRGRGRGTAGNFAARKVRGLRRRADGQPRQPRKPAFQTTVAMSPCHGAGWALAPPPPKPPPRPAGGSHCLGYHLGWASGWQGAHRKGKLRVLGSPPPPPPRAIFSGPRAHRGAGGGERGTPADPIF
jgi:hypothetical protein